MAKNISWTEEQVNKLICDIYEYCAEVLDREERKEPISESTKGTTYKIFPPDYPSIQEFQITYNYSNYIFELEKKYPLISESLTRIAKIQAMFIQRYGMNEQYSSAICKMAAMNNRELQWRDKTEQQINLSGTDGWFQNVAQKAQRK